jgi:hypothetical protein
MRTKFDLVSHPRIKADNQIKLIKSSDALTKESIIVTNPPSGCASACNRNWRKFMYNAWRKD